MEDRVSKEAKLNAAKEIVTAYIKSAVVKEGENQRSPLTAGDICSLFKDVYGTIEETLPSHPRKVGLGV